MFLPHSPQTSSATSFNVGDSMRSPALVLSKSHYSCSNRTSSGMIDLWNLTSDNHGFVMLWGYSLVKTSSKLIRILSTFVNLACNRPALPCSLASWVCSTARLLSSAEHFIVLQCFCECFHDTHFGTFEKNKDLEITALFLEDQVQAWKHFQTCRPLLVLQLLQVFYKLS